MNQQVACFGGNSKGKPSREAGGKTGPDIHLSEAGLPGLSLSDFLPRVPDLL